MTKTIWCAIVIGMTIFYGSQSANAVATGQIIEGCKNVKYLEYQAGELNERELVAAWGCFKYMLALMENNRMKCINLRNYAEGNPSKEAKLFATLLSDTENSQVMAVIQAFLNWAQAHPEHWDESPAVTSIEWLNEKWPCEL